MAKQGGMHKGGGTKSRGANRASSAARSPTRPNVQSSMRADADRPVGPGAGKHRGDRRDTNRQFTGNTSSRPNMGDPLGSGKKQTQGGGKAFKGGGKKRR